MSAPRSTKTFAMLPVLVLKSAAHRELTPIARCVLVALAGQYRGNNNGSLVITIAAMREYGICSADSIWSAEKQLVAHGLIVRTRRGQRIPKIASLYALTFQPLHAGPHGLASNKLPSNLWEQYISTTLTGAM